MRNPLAPPPLAAPLAPAVLEELERRLALVRRPASPAQLAERALQIAAELRVSGNPPRDLFLILAATALAGAAECERRDATRQPDPAETSLNPRTG